MKRRYVMVGSGPASIRACEALRSIDHEGEIRVVSAEAAGYYSRPGLAYYLAREIPERSLFPFRTKDLARLGVELIHGRVEELSPGTHELRLQDGQVVPYDRLLLATGSEAIMPAVPGIDLKGVLKLDDLNDARQIIELCRQARTAVVVGGGITAMEIVEGLRARKVKVHYFVRGDRYWSNVLSEPESRMVEKGLRDSGVALHYSTELAEIAGRKGRVTAARTAQGEEIPCQIIACAVGVLPRKGLAETAGIKCDRGVAVDDQLRSSDRDIFVAGDLAETKDPLTGQGTLEVLWNCALMKGEVAGLNMAGQSAHRYHRGAALNITRLAGFKTTIIGRVGAGKDADLDGIARGDSETWRRMGQAVTVESDRKGSHVRLVLSDGTITGAVVMGDQAPSFALQDLVASQARIGEIVESLQRPGAPVAKIVQGFWESWVAKHA